MSRTTAAAIVLATIGAAGVFYASAGDLEPPAGPVAPTMVTLDQIYDEVRGGGASASEARYYMQAAGINGDVDDLAGIPADSIAVFSLNFAGSVAFGGGGAGAFTISPIEVTIPVDSALPQLLRDAAVGTVLSEITVERYVTPQGSGPIVVEEWVFTGVRLTELEVAADDAGMARVMFVPMRIESRIAEMNPDGSIGSFRVFCWDVAANLPCP